MIDGNPPTLDDSDLATAVQQTAAWAFDVQDDIRSAEVGKFQNGWPLILSPIRMAAAFAQAANKAATKGQLVEARANLALSAKWRNAFLKHFAEVKQAQESR